MTHLERFEQHYQSLHHDGTLIFAGTLLQRAANRWPDHTAVICRQERITYKQLYDQSLHVTDYLINNGIKPRDRVMILYENSLNFYRAYYGAWQAGAVVVPVNTFLHEKELAHIINDAKPAGLLVSPESPCLSVPLEVF